jgi:hypothetical protein
MVALGHSAASISARTDASASWANHSDSAVRADAQETWCPAVAPAVPVNVYVNVPDPAPVRQNPAHPSMSQTYRNSRDTPPGNFAGSLDTRVPSVAGFAGG